MGANLRVKEVRPDERTVVVENLDIKDEFGPGVTYYTLPQDRFDELDLKKGDKVGLLLVKVP
jgi:hypothetical protein